MKLDCVICGRKDIGMRQTIHDGWCWWCISCKMRGYRLDSLGHPWPRREEDLYPLIDKYNQVIPQS